MIHTIQRIVQSDISNAAKEDVLSKLIGQFGIWQMIVFVSISLVKLSSGWVQMSILFLTPNFTFWCVEFDESSSNDTIFVENSTCYKNCMKYEYDTGQFGNTIVSEWDLVCERKWLASFTQMMLQLGVLVGSIVFGFLADRFGRKITFLISVTLVIVIGFGVPFSPNYGIFTALRFILGFATAGTMVISFVILMEAIGPKYRELFGCLFQVPFSIGHMTVPLFAYYFRSWSPYTLALAVPPLIYLGYFFVMSESPRWLVSVGRVDEATAIVTRAAEMNNLPTSKIKESLTLMSEAIQQNSSAPKPNYLHLLHRSLRVKTICCWFIWLITGVTFFGLNQYISQTSPNPYISVVVAAALNLPGVAVSIWLVRRFGRKATTIACCCLGGLCVIILALVPNTFAVKLTLGSLGVTCSSIVANTIYIYTSELFPTVVRNMAMGASSTSMRIGSMVAPFISNMSAVSWLPTAVFGIAPMVAAALCLLLPETKGIHLQDSIEDVKSDDR